MVHKIRSFFPFVGIVLFVCAGCQASGSVVKMKNISELSKHVGQTIEIEGKVSNIPWQHMIDFSDANPIITYLDVGGDQTVLYSKKSIECPSSVAVKGTVVEVKGKSKDPRSNDVYREYHIIADSWNCLGG